VPVVTEPVSGAVTRGLPVPVGGGVGVGGGDVCNGLVDVPEGGDHDDAGLDLLHHRLAEFSCQTSPLT